MNDLKTEVDTFLTYLKSASTAQKYLANCYHKLGLADAEAKSYQNSYRFLYYLEHGQTFYATANQAATTTQPILSFYGMVHLIKACLMTVRPDYPENTTMLAHGVSTRKRKKQQYSFLQDEVKVQQKGLYPYFANHLFHIKQLDYDKVDMNRLLATIPEMNKLFRLHREKDMVLKVGNLHDKSLYFPEQLLDEHHATENYFINKLQHYLPNVCKAEKQAQSIAVELALPLSPCCNGPCVFHLDESSFYFPKQKHYISTNNEIMNHYLLLYNLSMISRYETEWWGDLLHTMPNEDYPFIQKFLAITNDKIPRLLGYFMYEKAKGTNDLVT
ncbi:YaaC family protein [Radiobacillus sp. PE A8.2]|uniref:YaaC family protein n=1 Tax=Radiobacillus sp. PE A8.2 TaxID=3380349 RepID=UPI00388DCD7A